MWKKYNCSYQIAPNWEKYLEGGRPLFFLQTAGALNGEVRTSLTPLRPGGAISRVTTQGATLEGVFPSPPTQPAFSSWAARNRKGARKKKKETGVGIRRIFILRWSGYGICFLSGGKKEILWWKKRDSCSLNTSHIIWTQQWKYIGLFMG